MKGSLIIVSFFIVGTLCGLFQLIPYDFSQSKLSFYALCGLMFCVGISIGNDPQTLKSFRSLNPRLLFLPVMTILGTLAGCAVVSLFLSHRSPSDCMAVGSGFGYYSLSSIFITEYKGAELGTIALLSNIMREIIALLCAPLLVKFFGKLAPISVGGATTMDTTLPIITRCSGQEFVIVSIFHGFIVDFSVPFLVTLFCSIWASYYKTISVFSNIPSFLQHIFDIHQEMVSFCPLFFLFAFMLNNIFVYLHR